MASVVEMFHLAAAHEESGQWGQAEALYRQILDADPTCANAHNHLGLALHAAGRREEALAHFTRAARLIPRDAEINVNLGNALKEQGRLDEAAHYYQDALRINPALPQAHNNLGNVLKDQGRLAEAAECYRQALRLQPQYANASFNLGLALKAQGQLADAVECFRQALRVNPRFANAYFHLGNALRDQSKTDEAILYYRQATRIDPGHASAQINLANLLIYQGHLAEADACLRQTLQNNANHAEARNNLGVLLYKRGEFADSAAQFDEALRLDPQQAGARFNRSMLWLLAGDFDQGWREYEFRHLQPNAVRRTFPQPLWQGESLQGKTILLHAEQGLGDTLQFVRYAALVKKHGGTVLLECPAELVRILQSCAGIDRLCVQDAVLPPFDVHAPLLSLPRILKTTLRTIPAAIPYLHADAALVRHWQREIGDSTHFKIGIVWQGNPRLENPDCTATDRMASFPLAHLDALGRLPGVRLISLQKGHGTEQLAGRHDIVELGSRLHDFMDTAAVMMNLDLIISACTSPLHLAGALGRPVWAPLQLAACWRWLLHRDDSPWYPTMRLFRQCRFGDWTEVFERMAIALGDLVGGRGAF